jgi:hypothetical protein
LKLNIFRKEKEKNMRRENHMREEMREVKPEVAAEALG